MTFAGQREEMPGERGGQGLNCATRGVLIFGLLAMFCAAGCAARKRGGPPRIPGCSAPVIAPRGCDAVSFHDRVEIWCGGEKRWTYRCGGEKAWMTPSKEERS